MQGVIAYIALIYIINNNNKIRNRGTCNTRIYTRKEFLSLKQQFKAIMEEVMREKQIEQALVREVKKRAGLPLKFISPGLDGVPDRIILLPGGKRGFVELKAPGKHMRALQEKRKRQLESLGFLVFCLDNTEEIGGIIDAIQST